MVKWQKIGYPGSHFPVSQAFIGLRSAAGAFPYFSLPADHEPVNKPETQDFGHFMFGTGKQLQDVDGKVYFSDICAADDRQIWVPFTSTTAGASWMIVETESFEQTAGLLPAAKRRDAPA